MATPLSILAWQPFLNISHPGPLVYQSLSLLWTFLPGQVGKPFLCTDSRPVQLWFVSGSSQGYMNCPFASYYSLWLVEFALCSGIGLLEDLSDAEASLTSRLTEGRGFCDLLALSLQLASHCPPTSSYYSPAYNTVSLMNSWKLPGSISESLICPIVMPSYHPWWLPP